MNGLWWLCFLVLLVSFGDGGGVEGSLLPQYRLAGLMPYTRIGTGEVEFVGLFFVFSLCCLSVFVFWLGVVLCGGFIVW